MKTAPIALGAALVLAAGLIAGPDSAWAQRSGGGGGARGAFAAGGGGRAFASTSSGIPPALINGGVGGGPRVFGTLPGPRPAVNINQGFGHGFHHHKFFRPFFPFGIVAAAPAVVYAAPYYYPPDYYPPPYYDPSAYSAPVTYNPPVSYAPPPSSTVSVAPAPPAAPPSPNVVEFATGRYELRGDGVSTPYTWVWIPNPPTSPPPAAPSASQTGANSSSGGSGRVPPRAGQLYRWTDAQGVIYWTDRLDAVPEQYRSNVKTSPAS